MSDDQRQERRDDLQIAREAFITQAAGYAGVLLIAIAVHLVVSRRDSLRALARHAFRHVARPGPRYDCAVLEEMRTSLDEITHADLSEASVEPQ